MKEEEQENEEVESEEEQLEETLETDWEAIDILELVENDEEYEFDFKIFSINKSEIIKRWKELRKLEKAEEEKEKLGSLSPESQKKALKALKAQKKTEMMMDRVNDELNPEEDEEEEESSDDDIMLLSDLEDDKTYKEELKIVESIIQKFLIGSESSFLVDVNILLILKALPKKVHNLNVAQMNLFTFSILQNSMIAFQNQDQVNAFEFFDEFNRNRVQNIRTCILQQKDNLN